MILKGFSVTNYKIFKDTFTIDFTDNSIVILTGRNNTGKSTILEAINRFYQRERKTNTIDIDCFSNPDKKIVLKAIFKSTQDEQKEITIIKKYTSNSAPKFYDEHDKEINGRHELNDSLEELINNKPFYITPSMLPDDINELIQNIYSEVIKNELQKLEDMEPGFSEDDELLSLSNEYRRIKKSYPKFIDKLKANTDKRLSSVSEGVSEDLRNLFSNKDLTLNVKGGESEGISSNDILKSTYSSINIDSKKQKDMPLSNQGTGLQRMSLIYIIQNLIQNDLMGGNDNKLLLIDEPEAFLHPEAVRALSRSLYRIGEGMPLMISTHSPVLIDLSEKHTSIQLFRVSEIKAIELYKSKNDQFDNDDLENMKILNYIDPYVNEFFFAKKIIIVEGDTEYMAFKHFANIHNDNVHIVRARGKSTIKTMMKILNQFDASYDVLHDVDNNPEFSLSTLKAQLTNCKNIYKQKQSDKVRVFSAITNFEDALGLGDISNNKKTKTIYRIISESPEYKEAREKIENLYNHIVKRSNKQMLLGDFQEINSEQDYEVLFREIINKKRAKRK